jgi:hypothetical protein
MQVIETDFSEPVAGTVFEQLLQRLPDNEITRQGVHLEDVAGVAGVLGVERPRPGSDRQAYDDFYIRVIALAPDPRIRPVVPPWPPGTSAVNIGRTLWYANAGFDTWSVDRFARSMAFADSSGGSVGGYEVAYGEFDAASTAAALAACACDQPDVIEYGGFTYYSWGEDGTGSTDRRYGPPLYDSEGRGPRLLVRDGEAFWSFRNSALEDLIDVLNGSKDSLAADATYVAGLRWLASMGAIRSMSISSSGLSVYEGFRASGDDEQYLDDVLEAPLLKEFRLAASATGLEGRREFLGLALAHDSEAAAIENAELLIARVRGSRWANLIERIEVEAQGTFVLAKAYFYGAVQVPPVAGGQLLVHE